MMESTFVEGWVRAAALAPVAVFVLLPGCLTTPENVPSSTVPPSEKVEAPHVGAEEGVANGSGEAAATADAGVDSGATPNGGLAPEQIRSVVLGQAPAFQACFEIAIGRGHDAGEVRIAFAISPDGSVKEATMASSTFNDAAMDQCMLRGVRGLRFPTAEKQTNATFPFRFRKRP